MRNGKGERTVQGHEWTADASVNLRILVVDGDRNGASRLAYALARLRARMERPFDNATAETLAKAENIMDRFRPNVIFIDLTTTTKSVEDAYEFIYGIREKHTKGLGPLVVFVLYSDPEVLEKQCATFEWWNKRLRHYYRLGKAGNDEQFDTALDRELERVGLDLQIDGAMQTMENALRGDEPLFTVKQIEKLQGLLRVLSTKLEEVRKLVS
jgi:ActR/RegA family two-component response regulator